VVVCLPILTQPGVIKKALQAGKHVFSEKPIAGDVATAQELVDWHASLARAPLWGVAENFRFVKGLVAAADKVKEIGGDLVGFHLVQATLIAENNPFWLVDCTLRSSSPSVRSTGMLMRNRTGRKVPKYQGGFLLDGGIHNIAGLRLLLTAAGQEVAQVSCVSSLLKERLLPVDTVRAVAKATNGAGGIITMSYGTDFKNVTEIEVITTNGRVTWTPGGGVQAVWISDSGMRQEDSLGIEMDHGVLAEFEAFAESVETRALNPRQSPEEGLKDLRLLEALLRSGEEEAAVKKVGR